MVIILMGVSGAGKTTVGKALADALDFTFLDADDFHPTANIEKMARRIALNDDDRIPWLEALRAEIEAILAQRTDAVLACSALRQSYRDHLGGDNDAIRFVYLRGGFELIKTRLVKRQGRYMSADLLASQFVALEEPENCFAVDINASVAEIVGTIKTAFALCR